MIHLLSLKNWAKHHGKTFIFNEGLNLIKGENEAGKSLILEAIDYALHGSVALRLPASMYDSGLFVCLITTINNSRYRIERSPKKVELFDDETNTVLAKGSRPVDAEIKRLLGYNRNVFLMANYSCQDQISYLSSMTPAERKRTIDNVVGLTSVEQVIKQHKEELTLLNRMTRSIEGREVEKPKHPLFVRVENVDDLIAKKRERVAQYIAEHQHQLTIKNTLARLEQHKPEPQKAPNLSGLIAGLTNEMIIGHRSNVKHLQNQEINILAKLEKEKEPKLMPKPNLDGLIEGLTDEKIKAHDTDLNSVRAFITLGKNLMAKHEEIVAVGKYSQAEIQACLDQENLFENWQHVQKLKNKGSVNCNHCGGEVFVATEALSEFSHIVDLELVEAPKVSSRTMLQVNRNIAEAEKEIAEQQSTQNGFIKREEQLVQGWYTQEQLKDHRLTEAELKLFNDAETEYLNWRKRTEGLTDDLKTVRAELTRIVAEAPTDAEIEKHSEASHRKAEYEKYCEQLEAWENQCKALDPYDGDDNLEILLSRKGEQEVEISGLELSKSEWAEYDQKLNDYTKWFDDYTVNQDALAHEKSIVDSLQDYKGRIKSSILPSVNAVATTWLKRMSLGKHVKVELTDDMDILVNDTPIDALSISGRALGHLSLRMALGQVLTTRVYPVFIADEVDASMRDERAQEVLNSLTDMLNGSVKQIIMISHRELEHEATLIEV